MTFNLQDRRIVTALAGIFMLGLACLLLLGLAVLVLCAMLVNALVSTIAETVTTIGTLYSHTGPLAHLLMLLAVLFGIPYSFKRVRMPAIRFFQRQFARFSAFAQRAAPADDAAGEREEDRDYEEGEVIDLDAKEETHRARTAANHATTTSGRSRKQRKNKKRPRRTTTARAVLALTHT